MLVREEDLDIYFFFLLIFFFNLHSTDWPSVGCDVSVLRLAAHCLLIDRVRENDGVCGVVGYLAGFRDTACVRVHCRVPCS